MNKESYTFSEIVFGLREEYQKNQKLLEELKKYIIVEGKNNDDYVLKTEILRKIKLISLEINNKQSKLMKIIEYLSFKYLGIINDNYYEPCYITKKDDNKYTFIKDNTVISNKNYNIEITDNNAFNDTADKILQSKIINNSHIELNPFQRIDINSNEISMYGRFDAINSKAFPTIKYNPNSDTIIALLYDNIPITIIEEFFNTKIPKNLIADDYRKIIDNNLENKNIKEINTTDKNSELNIYETNKGIVLTKKRKIKLY